MIDAPAWLACSAWISARDVFFFVKNNNNRSDRDSFDYGGVFFIIIYLFYFKKGVHKDGGGVGNECVQYLSGEIVRGRVPPVRVSDSFLQQRPYKGEKTGTVLQCVCLRHAFKKKASAIYLGNMLTCVNLLINVECWSQSCTVGEKDASCSHKRVIIEARAGSRLYSRRIAPCSKLISIIARAAERTQISFYLPVKREGPC